MNQLRRLFAAPIFEDQEKTGIAAWLHAILLTVLTSAIALPVLAAILAPEPSLKIALMAILVAAVSVGLLLLLRRGHVRAVGLLLSLTLWTSFTIAIYSFDGIRDTAISGYFFVIILISLICRRGTVIAFSLASLLAIAGAYVAERSGTLVVSLNPMSAPIDLIIIVLALILSTLLLHLAVKNQRAAHQALRQERNRAQQYLDVASVILLALDRNGRVTLLNHKGCHILGYDEEELIGQDWFQTCLPARVRNEVRQIFDGLVRDRIAPTETFEQPVLTQSGEERIIRWHNALLRDETGQIVGTLSSGHDITAQVSLEKARRESEQRYRAVAEATIAGIGITDANERFTYVNPAFARMLGYTPDEMLGMNLAQLTLPEEFERFTRFTVQREEGATNTYETRLRHRDGHTLSVLVSASPLFTTEGRFESTLAVVVDITGQVRASQELEERKTYLEGVLEAAPDAIVTLTPEQLVVEWNSGAEKLFGYTAQEAVGRDLDDLVTIPEIRREATALRQMSLSGQQVGPVETVRYHQDGTPIDVLISGGPITVGERLIGHVAVYADITARKQAERALKESQERLLAMLDGIDAHIYVADMETYEILFMNRLMRRDFGDGLEGQICWQAFRGRAERCPHCSNEKLIDAEGSPTGVYVWEGQNPITGRWYANYDRAIRWVDGRVVRLQIATDITARKQAERELLERQVYLEGVLNAAPDAIITLDADHRIVEWNPGAERLFQYTAAEAVGRNLDDLVNDPQTIDQAVTLTEKVLAQEPVGPIEAVRYRKDGTPVDIIVAGAPIVVGDELIGAVGIYTDITERKLAENALRELNLTLEEEVMARTKEIRAEKEKSETILRSVGDAIGVSTPDLKITYVNDAFTALTGYAREEAIGQSSNFVLAERLSGPEWQALREALIQEEVWHGEAVLRRKDGRTYEAAVTVAPLLDAEGRLAGYISSHRDISRLKNLDRAKSHFITNISHELRTPTANIKLYTHLMQKDESGEKSERYFQVLRGQAERLEKLIEDVVEMTELDSGPIITTWETLDLASLVESRIAHFQSQALAADLALEMKPVPSRLPPVKGDQHRLTQALDKLIENALIFTPGGGRVTLEIGSAQTSGITWATIAVRDTGPGLPAEEQKRIFERFYRGSLAESGHIPGTGLGLSVVQAIAQAHGGQVTAASEEGRGSTFTLWLQADASPG